MAFAPHYVCGKCGKRYAKTDSHRCYLDEVERHFSSKIEESLKVLTPREQKRLEFDRWCLENGRL